jgi:hypothetical protein
VTGDIAARPAAGTAGDGKQAGVSGTGHAVAWRGDLVVIHLRRRDWKDGRLGEGDELWAGQVTSVTRDGLVRLYQPAGKPEGRPAGAAGPAGAKRLPSLWSGVPRSRARTRPASRVLSPRRPATSGPAMRIRCAATAACRTSGPRCVRTCWNTPGRNSCARQLVPGREHGGTHPAADLGGPRGELTDFPSAVLAAGAAAGLIPAERCVALLAGAARRPPHSPAIVLPARDHPQGPPARQAVARDHPRGRPGLPQPGVP